MKQVVRDMKAAYRNALFLSIQERYGSRAYQMPPTPLTIFYPINLLALSRALLTTSEDTRFASSCLTALTPSRPSGGAMSAHVPRIKRGISIAIAVAAIGACGTDLGGPYHAPLRVPQARPDFIQPSEISIVDNDGTQYTLSIPDREVRFSDGRVLRLTDDQTDSVAEAFYATNATDPVAQDVQSLGAYYPYDPNCADPTKVCNEDRNIQISPPISFNLVCPSLTGCKKNQIRAAAPAILIRRPSSELDEPPRRRHAPSNRVRAHYEGRRLNSSRGFSFAQYGGTSADACTNVVNDAVSTASDYFNKRSSFIKDIWEVAVAEAANELIKFLPVGSGAEAALGTKLLEHRAAAVNVNVLAFVWNTYGCSQRTVFAGPVYLPGNYTQSTNVVCQNQHWDISFDGGNTWHGIWVRVCEAMS